MAVGTVAVRPAGNSGVSVCPKAPFPPVARASTTGTIGSCTRKLCGATIATPKLGCMSASTFSVNASVAASPSPFVAVNVYVAAARATIGIPPLCASAGIVYVRPAGNAGVTA